MASRIENGEHTGTFGGLKCVYVNDTPVGNGSDNKRIADVQLVQLFLRYFYYMNPALFKKLPKPGRRSAPEILLDGKVGDQTITGISVFQQYIIGRGKSGLYVDGRVSTPTGFRVAGTSHVFTIFQLNVYFFNTNPLNKSFNENLAEHPVVKSSLTALATDIRQ
jgi:hypothetical protein